MYSVFNGMDSSYGAGHGDTTDVLLRRNEAVMGCIMHSMMFEAQMTDMFEHVSKKEVKSKEQMGRREKRRRSISEI